jgi:hypothetical protein
MIERTAGTSGGEDGTDGARHRRILWLTLGFVAFAALQAYANAESTLTDFERAGIPQRSAHVWIWELSSLTLWVLLLPAIWWMVRRIRPPRVDWRLAAFLHLAATVPISVVHVLGMIALRFAAYAALGDRYGFGSLPAMMVYEYRKDAATYFLLGAFAAFAQWFVARPSSQVEAPDQDVILVPDGNVTHHVPVDAIDWAASAGNYVEIAWGPRVLLHRSTLAALAEMLGPRFVRIHRGRIVRRAAIERIETDRSGDFAVTLAGGTVLRGSRRFRGGLG